MKRYLLISFWLYLFFLSIFFVSGRGYILPSDGERMYQVTESMIERQSFMLGKSILRDSTLAYSDFDLGYSIINIPLFLIGKFAVYLLPNLPKEFLLRFFYSFSSAFIASFLCVIVFNFSRAFIESAKISLCVTLIFGLATTIFPYAKDVITVVPSSLFLILTAYIIFIKKPEKKWLFISGISLGCAILTRCENIIALPIFLGYIMFTYKGEYKYKSYLKSTLLNICRFLLPVIFFGCLSMYYNKIRSGSIFAFRIYLPLIPSRCLFGTPIWKGLFGLLFSPGRGVFLYSPILLLFPWGIIRMFKTYKKEAILFLTIICAFILLYGKYTMWHGSRPSWGPRYLVNLIPFFVLPIGFFIKDIFINKKYLAKFIVAVLVIISVSIQLLPTITAYDLYQEGEENPDLYIFNFHPRHSPIISLAKNISNFTIKPIEYKSLSFSQVHDPEFKLEFLRTPDFWWMYFYRLRLSRIYIPIIILLTMSIVLSLIKLLEKIKS